MRKISSLQLLTFFAIASVVTFLGCASSWLTVGQLVQGSFQGIAVTFGAFVFIEGFAVGAYRILLTFCPLKEGSKRKGSKDEFHYHLYVLMNLFFFYPIVYSGIVPIPLLRPIYLLLGARIGTCSYGPAHISDPPLTIIGDSCLLGHGALIAAHHNTGEKLSHATVRIGNRVTIGGGVMIGAGARIEDDVILSAGARIAPFSKIGNGATVAPCAYIKTGSRIGAGETWAGIPAVCVLKANESMNLESSNPSIKADALPNASSTPLALPIRGIST